MPIAEGKIAWDFIAVTMTGVFWPGVYGAIVTVQLKRIVRTSEIPATGSTTENTTCSGGPGIICRTFMLGCEMTGDGTPMKPWVKVWPTISPD